MSFERIARSVLKAKSDFSTAVMTPLTLSVLPVMASSTARLASSCNLETSSMLLRSVSEKLAPPVSPGDCVDLPAASPTRPTFAKLFTPLIMPTTAATRSASPCSLPSPSRSLHKPAMLRAHSHIPRPDRCWDRKHNHPCSHRDDWADIPCETDPGRWRSC